jgi:hypothetical protein
MIEDNFFFIRINDLFSRVTKEHFGEIEAFAACAKTARTPTGVFHFGNIPFGLRVKWKAHVGVRLGFVDESEAKAPGGLARLRDK